MTSINSLILTGIENIDVIIVSYLPNTVLGAIVRADRDHPLVRANSRSWHERLCTIANYLVPYDPDVDYRMLWYDIHNTGGIDTFLDASVQTATTDDGNTWPNSVFLMLEAIAIKPDKYGALLSAASRGYQQLFDTATLYYNGHGEDEDEEDDEDDEEDDEDDDEDDGEDEDDEDSPQDQLLDLVYILTHSTLEINHITEWRLVEYWNDMGERVMPSAPFIRSYWDKYGPNILELDSDEITTVILNTVEHDSGGYFLSALTRMVVCATRSRELLGLVIGIMQDLLLIWGSGFGLSPWLVLRAVLLSPYRDVDDYDLVDLIWSIPNPKSDSREKKMMKRLSDGGKLDTILADTLIVRIRTTEQAERFYRYVENKLGANKVPLYYTVCHAAFMGHLTPDGHLMRYIIAYEDRYRAGAIAAIQAYLYGFRARHPDKEPSVHQQPLLGLLESSQLGDTDDRDDIWRSKVERRGKITAGRSFQPYGVLVAAAHWPDLLRDLYTEYSPIGHMGEYNNIATMMLYTAHESTEHTLDGLEWLALEVASFLPKSAHTWYDMIDRGFGGQIDEQEIRGTFIYPGFVIYDYVRSKLINDQYLDPTRRSDADPGYAERFYRILLGLADGVGRRALVDCIDLYSNQGTHPSVVQIVLDHTTSSTMSRMDPSLVWRNDGVYEMVVRAIRQVQTHTLPHIVDNKNPNMVLV